MFGTLILPTSKQFFLSPEFGFSSSPTTRCFRTITPLTSRKTCMASFRAFADTNSLCDSRKSASLYEILRVKQSASPLEIKTAYRSLAKLYHPDSLNKLETDGRHFIDIHNAYSTLSDPAARTLYDLSLEDSQRRSFAYSDGKRRSGFYTPRRWETDQCW